MKRIAPLSIFLLALVTLGFLIFGENSYSRIDQLRRNITQQRQRNNDSRQRVEDLKTQVYNLQNDSRALEKAARNELGMARPKELIYLFEKDRQEVKLK